MLTSLLEHVLALLPVIAMQGFVISSFSPKTSLFWYGGRKTTGRALLFWAVAVMVIALLNIICYAMVRNLAAGQ